MACVRLDMYDFVGETGANLNVTAKIAAPSKARRGTLRLVFKDLLQCTVQYYSSQEIDAERIDELLVFI